MKVAHISDLHLNTLFTDSNLNKIKTLLNYIMFQEPDHLVISGDLTDNADETDMILLKKLLKKYDLLDGTKCTIVPGNHDIYGGPQKAEDLFSFPEKCKKTNYTEKLQLFNNIFSSTFDNCVYTSENNLYPFLKLIRNTLIIGLNSNAEYSSLKNPFASNGEISISQFNELNRLLTEYRNLAANTIIIIHHHFNKIKSLPNSIAGLWHNIEKQTMKLKKKKRLLDLFRKHNVNLVLHGHTHRSDEYFRKGIRFLNSGASIRGSSDKSLRVNIITINDSKIETEIHKVYDKGKVAIKKPEKVYNDFSKVDNLG
jgi:3',5'-cyclic AMP phosphodiesterase CpdA